MIVILVILSICLIYLVGIFIYTVPSEMNDDGSTPNTVEAQKKAEPTISISINLYSKQTSLDGTHYKYQVPISHMSFYIPNIKDTLVYNNSNFIVREVKRDFNSNKVIITAYKV